MPKPASRPRKSKTPAKRAKLSAHHRRGVTESVEDYLECIANLVKANGYASISDVAETLDVIRPSASLMVKRLAGMGYLDRKPYRGFVLTDSGRDIAAAIQARHAVLTELFERLGLDPRKHLDDIEGIEHHLSESTLARLRDLIRHLQKHPIDP